MNYLGYVIGAYSVFAIVMLWDYLIPRLKIAHTLRTVHQRARREAARTNDAAEQRPPHNAADPAATGSPR
jgi:heme exporter protein D